MASAAMPRHRIHRHCRLSREWNRRAFGWGTLMRHFFVFRPVTALALGVGMTASPAGLIAATGGTDSGASSLRRTRLGAVTLASITVAANDHRRTAAGTKVVSSCGSHGQRPMGERQQGPLCEILGRRRCPSGQRGAASELAWRLAPVSRRHLHRLWCFYRIDSIGANASLNTIIPSPAALRLPDGSLLRKPPAGRPAGCRLKPIWIDQNGKTVAITCCQDVDTRFLRKLSAVNKWILCGGMPRNKIHK
jgi:hypothetical protein